MQPRAPIHSFRDLKVWQLGVEIVERILLVVLLLELIDEERRMRLSLQRSLESKRIDSR